MSYLPGTPFPFSLNRVILKDDGTVNALGYIECYAAGTLTPLTTCSDALLTTANPTTLDLDAQGRPTVAAFLRPTGYQFKVFDAAAVEQTASSVDDFENPGAVFASLMGALLTDGLKAETSGYIMIASDRLVTFDGTGGPNPCNFSLLPANQFDFGWVGGMNFGNVDVAVSPNGSDTINGISGVGAFTIASSDGTVFPFALFWSDRVSKWYAWPPQVGSMLTCTFAELPAQPKLGMQRWVTDADTDTWGADIGGGSNKSVGVVFNDAGDWTVFAK